VGKYIFVEKRNGMAIVFMNRVEKHNSFDLEMLKEFRGVLKELKEDQNIRVLMITGAGEKSFSTGVDLSILNDFEDTIAARNFALELEGLMEEIFNFPRPTISLVNGYAMGGGFGIALSSDIRVLSKNAKIGFPAVKVGAVFPTGCTMRLISHIGLGRAKDLILTGRILSGEEAFRIGLGDYLVEHDKLMEKGYEVAAMIMEGTDLALSIQKSVVNNFYGALIHMLSNLSADSFAFLSTTPDWKQKIDEFINKK